MIFQSKRWREQTSFRGQCNSMFYGYNHWIQIHFINEDISTLTWYFNVFNLSYIREICKESLWYCWDSKGNSRKARKIWEKHLYFWWKCVDMESQRLRHCSSCFFSVVGSSGCTIGLLPRSLIFIAWWLLYGWSFLKYAHEWWCPYFTSFAYTFYFGLGYCYELLMERRGNCLWYIWLNAYWSLIPGIRTSWELDAVRIWRVKLKDIAVVCRSCGLKLLTYVSLGGPISTTSAGNIAVLIALGWFCDRDDPTSRFKNPLATWWFPSASGLSSPADECC